MANDDHPNPNSSPAPIPSERFTFKPPLPEDASRAKQRGEGSFLSEVASRAKQRGEGPLQEEIDSMRRALKRLLESFSQVESIDEQYKLSSAINLTTASIFRLVRTQGYFLSNRNTEMNQTIDDVITEILKEWGRI